MDRSYLSEIETGKKDPSLTILKTIADGFGISLSEFFRRIDPAGKSHRISPVQAVPLKSRQNAR